MPLTIKIRFQHCCLKFSVLQASVIVSVVNSKYTVPYADSCDKHVRLKPSQLASDWLKSRWACKHDALLPGLRSWWIGEGYYAIYDTMPTLHPSLWYVRKCYELYITLSGLFVMLYCYTFVTSIKHWVFLYSVKSWVNVVFSFVGQSLEMVYFYYRAFVVCITWVGFIVCITWVGFVVCIT